MAEIADALAQATRLVKQWEQTRMPSGQTLGEALTVSGIPFWDVFAADLARVHLPAVLSATTPNPGLLGSVRPYLSRAKHVARDLVRQRRSVSGCSTWPGPHPALCLGFGWYLYRDIVQPVAEHLVRHQGLPVVSLSDSEWPEAGGRREWPCQTIWQHWDKAVAEQAAQLRRKLKAVETALYAPDGLPRMAGDVEPGLWDRLKGFLGWFFRVHVPLLIPHAAVAKHILERHEPSVVISPDVADPRTRVYTLLCRQMGIPSIEIQSGPIGTAGIEIEWEFLVADAVAAWGDTSKTALMIYGVPAGRIAVSGSPRHDCLINVDEADVRRRRADLGVPEGSTMAVLASAYHLGEYEDYSDPELLRVMKRAVFRAADRTDGFTLVVKPHPLEDVTETKHLAGSCQHITFVDQRSDIRELTRVCDVFVSFGSTATADALIAGKLTVCPLFPGWTWNELFGKSGATLLLESEDAVAEAFQTIATGGGAALAATLEPARQRFLKDWVFQADGQASRRIADLAVSMAHRKPGMALPA